MKILSDTKKFIGELSAIKTDIIHSGIDMEVPSPDVCSFQRNYILYIGDRRRHKNLKRMIDLFLSLKSKNLYAEILL